MEYRSIDLNRITMPVIELAMKKAEKYKQEMVRKYVEAVRNAKNWKELEEIDHTWNEKMEEIYDTSLCNDEIAKWILDSLPSDDTSILDYISRRYLLMKPEIGRNIIMQAYHEYYDIGRKCEYCGKIFISRKSGRKAKYCSESCRQLAYRRRKRRQSIN